MNAPIKDHIAFIVSQNNKYQLIFIVTLSSTVYSLVKMSLNKINFSFMLVKIIYINNLLCFIFPVDDQAFFFLHLYYCLALKLLFSFTYSKLRFFFQNFGECFDCDQYFILIGQEYNDSKICFKSARFKHKYHFYAVKKFREKIH